VQVVLQLVDLCELFGAFDVPRALPHVVKKPCTIYRLGRYNVLQMIRGLR
jgi:hypothetical protein